MEFLRRLVPRGPADLTRAVAALPSPFESQSPLRETVAQPSGAWSVDDERVRETDVPLAHAASNRGDSGPATPGHRKVHSAAFAADDALDLAVIDARVLLGGRGTASERPRAASRGLEEAAAAHAASREVDGVAGRGTQSGVAMPLSQAILAQRTLPSHADGEVVHVTIGRIEVVANVAPAPPLHRRPTSRPPTRSLAEYLRDENGIRR